MSTVENPTTTDSEKSQSERLTRTQMLILAAPWAISPLLGWVETGVLDIDSMDILGSLTADVFLYILMTIKPKPNKQDLVK